MMVKEMLEILTSLPPEAEIQVSEINSNEWFSVTSIQNSPEENRIILNFDHEEFDNTKEG